MRKWIKTPLIVALTFATFITTAGTLSMDKPRILITDSNKRTEFKVFNTSPEVQTLRISLIDKQMDEMGSIKTVEKSPISAAKFIRVGPRVGKNIAPKDFQKFRVRAKLGKLPPGEYRSHILVESMSPPKEETKPGVFIKPNIKYSIPIIVRRGKLSAQLAIKNAKISQKILANGQKQSILEFAMTRQGERSVYGDFTLYQVKNGKTTLLQKVIGQAIYTDVNQRQFTVNLQQVLAKDSELKIEFRENPDFGGNSQITGSIKV